MSYGPIWDETNSGFAALKSLIFDYLKLSKYKLNHLNHTYNDKIYVIKNKKFKKQVFKVICLRHTIASLEVASTVILSFPICGHTVAFWFNM